MSAIATLDQRTRATVRGACGVRINPGHWASINVHAFRRWLADSVVLTWCDLEIDVSGEGKMTTDTISCSACGQQSWRAIRG